MRELKVRLWDAFKEEMLKPQAITFDVKSLVPFAVKVSGGAWEQVDKYELLQWTGLKDLNGIDVYEGDIVKIASILYLVNWNNTAAGFELHELYKDVITRITDVASGTVVGNRFQKLKE